MESAAAYPAAAGASRRVATLRRSVAKRRPLRSSIRQVELQEAGELRADGAAHRPGVQVLEAGARDERRQTEGEDGVLAQQRAVLEAHAHVDADVVVDAA